MSKNIQIKVSTQGEGKPFIKQLPQMKPLWGNCVFYINEDIPECDLWVTYGGLQKVEEVLCAKENTLLITTEPPSIKRYNKKFTNQFGAIITCQRNIKHSNVIYSQQALPWWVGHKLINNTDNKYYKTYDELKYSETPKKEKLLSIIVSGKTFTRGHKKRYEFVKKLKKELGGLIDVFGSGFNAINDKWDAIAPYKYHIVIENSSYEDYFTEKLSDSFLGEAYPIYYGCPNIYKYFPENSLTKIDIEKPDIAIRTIRDIIESGIYDKSTSTLTEAKNLILDKYQLFPLLYEYANNITSKNRTLIKIKPEREKIFKIIIRKILKVLNLR